MVGIRDFQPKKRETVSGRDWDGSTVWIQLFNE